MGRPRFAIAEALEPRVLYSVDALGPLAPLLGDEQPVETRFDLLNVPPPFSVEVLPAASDVVDLADAVASDDQIAATQSVTRQLAFIDADVPDVDRVIDSLEKSGIDSVMIEANDDGLLVISQVLAKQDDLTAVHIISHGSAGSLNLGNAELNADSVESNAAALVRWGDVLSDDADILFYGCDLAANEQGVALIDRIAQLTDADVAASDDMTGHASLGADWDLELSTGTIETVFFGDSSFRQEWLASLETITVTTLSDPFINPSWTISDLNSLSEVSLRGAISAANNTAGDHTIILGVGDYELTRPSIPNVGDAGNFNLDLEVENDGTTSSLIIRGAAGEGLTNIIQTEADRVLLLVDGELSLEHITISGGVVNDIGGGISTASSTVLNTLNVTFENNQSNSATSGGGGVAVQGAANFENTKFVNNNADFGGGIASNGQVVLQNTTFDMNQASSSGGGLYTEIKAGSSLAVSDTLFTSNTAGANAGAMFLQIDDVVIDRVTFYDNSAADFGGAISLLGADAVLTNTTFSENHANIGGAMYVQQDATVRNSTFYENYDKTFNDAGAISIAGGTVTLANNVFDNNYTGSAGTKADVKGDVISSGFNIFTLFTGINFLGGQAETDIALQPDGLTMDLELLAPSVGYVSTHAPMAGSPVINAGGSTEYTSDATGSLHDEIPDAGAHEYKPATSVKFWIDTSGDIWRSAVDGSNARLIASTPGAIVEGTRDIEVDLTNGRLYWIAESGAVQSTTLDGSAPVTDVITGLTVTTGIAIDAFNNRLFVADRGTKEILGYMLDTSGVAPAAGAETTVTTTTNEVNDIEFDAVNNLLVWTEAPGNGMDGRVVSRALDVSTDGDDSTNSDVYTHNGNLDGLTLDSLTRRIFVAESSNGELLSINYAGDLLDNLNAVVGQRIEFDAISEQVVVSQFESGSGFNYLDHELSVPFLQPLYEGPEALAISVTNGVDIPPTISVPVAVDVVQGSTAVIDGTSLSSTDDFNSPWRLKWEVVDLPLYGVILVDGVDIATLPVTEQYFTQEQLNDGVSVIFQHDDSTTSPTDFITVRLTDGVNITSSVQLDFNVEAKPVFTSPVVFDVAENVTSVGSVVSTDVDGGVPQYTLVGTVDDTLFSIDINTGALSFITAPNFESATDVGGDNVYNVTVQADDGNGGIVTQALSITVTDVNEFTTSTISDSDGSVDSIVENAAIGTGVGITGTAQDQDATDTVSYTLDNDSGGLFVIDSTSGVVTLNGSLDYESAASHTITIRATSTDTSFATQDYTIAVGDVNDSAPVVTPAQRMSIAENAAPNSVVGTVLATDADTVGSLQSWTITGGNDNGAFQIDAATGQITVAEVIQIDAATGQTTIADTTNLDSEVSSLYLLSVQVGDGVNTSAAGFVLIDIDDEPTFTSSPIVSATEDVAYNYNISSDDVAGNGVTITGLSVPAWLTLTDNGDGTATLSGTPTNAEVGVHSVELQLSDGASSSTQSFTISVDNVNDAPVFTSPVVFDVAENVTSVGSVVSTDVDGGVPQYTLVGTVDDTLFSIDINTGALSFIAAPNFESATDVGGDNVYNVTVQTDDGNGGIVTQALSITVTNVNEFTTSTISDSDGSVDSIAENAAIGTGVGITGTAQDQDAPDTVSYTLDNDSGGLFVIDSTSGVVTLNGSLDYESAASHTITIRATSTDTSFATQDYTIAVGDVNDNAPVVTPAQSMSIAENAAPNSVVGTVLATDADTAGSLQSWTITGGNAEGVFQIDATTGQITLANTTNLNHETTSQYTLSVHVSDGVNTSAVENVVIDIDDVNEVPTFTSLPIVSATEGVAYDYNISSDDVDGDGVTITGLTVPAWLTLMDNSDGTATLSGTPTNAEVGVHSVELQLSDGASSSTQSFTISVDNVNDAPVFTSPVVFDVAENVTSVGSVVSTDVDGGVPQYTLVGTVDDTLFSIDINTGALSFIAAPNFESATDVGGDNVYNVTVQTDDGNGGIVTQALSITVTNVNEFTTSTISDSDGSVDSIAENAAIGTGVGITGTAQDQDAPDTVSYTLDNDSGGLFVIDSTSGVVTLNGSLDYESAASHTITIRATSTDTSFATQDYTIAVGDVNDNAPVVTPAQSMSIAENAAPNSVVGTVLATDADTAGSLQSWTITGGNDDGAFQIDAATGQITVAEVIQIDAATGQTTIADTTNLDSEVTSQYTLSVQVSDGVNTSAVGNVLIDIDDVNEVPTFTSLPISSTTEGVAYNYNISSDDVDGDGVTITGFTVPAWLTLTDNSDGTATLSGTPTNSEVGVHRVELRLSDGALSSTQSFTVTVDNVNDAPHSLILNNASVAENSSGVRVGTLSSTDDDTGDVVSYRVDDPRFEIRGNELFLGQFSKLDFESEPRVPLQITALDLAGSFVTQTFTISVTDQNDAPVLNSAPDAPVLAKGTTYQIPADTFGDADGDTLSYTVLQSSGEALPDWLEFRESSAEFVLVDAAAASEALTIELIADDGRGGSTSVSIELRFEPDIGAAEPTVVPVVEVPAVEDIPPTVNSEPENTPEAPAESVAEEVPEALPADLPADDSATEILIAEVDLASLTKPLNRSEIVEVIGNGAKDAVARLLNARTDSQTADDIDSIDLSIVFSEAVQTISRDYSEFVDTLDKKREEMAENARFSQTLVGSSVGITSGLSAGYLIWLIRGGTLMGSMLSSLPAWRLVDPLPVLGALEGSGNDDGESLESMVDDTSMPEHSEAPPQSDPTLDNQQED